MKIDKTIKESVLLNIQSISDNKGLLVPFTDDNNYDHFHRAYIGENYGKGVIRGLNYHIEEMKVFIIGSGAAKLITMKLPEEVVRETMRKRLRHIWQVIQGW
jgi:dTDP-4-dehydrorhamnose 3,5-epimerase-like enzyme